MVGILTAAVEMEKMEWVWKMLRRQNLQDLVIKWM